RRRQHNLEPAVLILLSSASGGRRREQRRTGESPAFYLVRGQISGLASSDGNSLCALSRRSGGTRVRTRRSEPSCGETVRLSYGTESRGTTIGRRFTDIRSTTGTDRGSVSPLSFGRVRDSIPAWTHRLSAHL